MYLNGIKYCVTKNLINLQSHLVKMIVILRTCSDHFVRGVYWRVTIQSHGFGGLGPQTVSLLDHPPTIPLEQVLMPLGTFS